MTDPIKIAKERFSAHYSCSQSVFTAFSTRFGLTDDQALKLSSPFGGGMALQGHVCGAVTGALMVIGLAYGTVDPKDKKKVYQAGGKFLKQFEEKNDTLLCRELTGFDFRVPGELQAFKDQKASTTICPNFVDSAVELLTAILEE